MAELGEDLGPKALNLKAKRGTVRERTPEGSLYLRMRKGIKAKDSKLESSERTSALNDSRKRPLVKIQRFFWTKDSKGSRRKPLLKNLDEYVGPKTPNLKIQSTPVR